MCECIDKIKEVAAKKGIKVFLPFEKLHYKELSPNGDIVEEYELKFPIIDKDGNRKIILFESYYCPFCGRKKFNLKAVSEIL